MDKVAHFRRQEALVASPPSPPVTLAEIAPLRILPKLPERRTSGASRATTTITATTQNSTKAYDSRDDAKGSGSGQKRRVPDSLHLHRSAGGSPLFNSQKMGSRPLETPKTTGGFAVRGLPSTPKEGLRPLPPIPVSAPARDGTGFQVEQQPQQRSSRSKNTLPSPPLPAVPPTPRSGGHHQFSLVVSSPPTLLQPLQKHQKGSQRPPRTVPSLSLQTGGLRPVSKFSTGEMTVVSPLPPDIPIAPSPMTARRKRMSKLRRHLGERVPDEMMGAGAPKRMVQLRSNGASDIVFASSGSSANRSGGGFGPMVVPALSSSSTSSDSSSASSLSSTPGSPPPMPVKRNVKIPLVKAFTDSDSEGEWVDEEGSDDDDCIDELDGQWEFLTTFKDTPLNRYSKKWIKEKGGNRWVEEDVDNVMRRLRAL